MPLAAGSRFGQYDVVGAIGVGGMGEVYRAHDAALRRDVAIKVLPASFATDAARVARFEQEARTLAALNHSNIGQIYGLEKADGMIGLVMELVDGLTLQERIAQGPLPPKEALGIALQIAAALEAAHGRGIVHRDLKPANIKIKPDGAVKVLDFGIAKALDAPQTTGSKAATLTTPAMTEAGILLGTAAYMSPEQARGKPIDQRTDIWAFGCVLFEMLTGQSAFGGEDVMVTLARVLDRDTNMSSLPSLVAPAVRQTLRLCLQKDVRERIADIRDVRLALQGAFESGLPAAPSSVSADTRPAWRRGLPIAAALVAGAVVTGLVGWSFLPSEEPKHVTRFSFQIPAEQGLRAPVGRALDISPDGRTIVYNANDGFRVRRMGELGSTPIPGSTGALLFGSMSPDGQAIAYFEQPGVTKRIALTGGAPQLLASTLSDTGATTPRGTRWTEAGIFYGQDDGIYQLPASGGQPKRVVEPRGERLFGAQLLPDGDSLLFSSSTTTDRDASQIVVQSLSTGERKVILSGGSDARYLPTGHIAYAFQNQIMAIAFDPKTLTTSGNAVSVVQGVLRAVNDDPAAQFSVSSTGTLAYIAGNNAGDQLTNEIVWVSREGRTYPSGLPSRPYQQVRVSPDGSSLALYMSEDGNSDIWVSDVERPVLSRITNAATPETFPIWSFDGRRVIFWDQSTPGARKLGWTLADGTGTPETLLTIEGGGLLSPGTWVPDGSGFVFTYGAGSAQPQIGLLTIAPAADGTRAWRPLITRSTGASAVNVSPRGDWIAYHTDDTGQYGIYIERFPELGDRRLISDQRGGWGAIWSRAGDEVFYRRLGDGAMMSVSVQTSPTLRIGAPTMLFETRGFLPVVTPEAGGGSARSWDLAPDGRFAMIRLSAISSTNLDVVVVENWFEELKRLVPTP
jgi:serine/threonine protein kinase/Tol biopolymer transport system component